MLVLFRKTLGIWQLQMKSHINETNKDVFCIAPFAHMYVHSTEKPKPCCASQQINDYWEDKNEKRNLKEEWTSDFYQHIRKNMLAGIKTESCARCYITEEYNGISDRLYFNRRYENIEIELDIKQGNQYGTPLDFDIRPGTLCNLQCRMCNPESSTQIEKEVKRNPQLFNNSYRKEVIQPLLSSTENIDFLLENCHIGNQIKFLGGEPTIMPEVHKILKILIEKKKTNIGLFFTSNFTNANKSFLDLLSKFENIKINASIDGTDSTIEYIRYPVNWEHLQKNI